MIEQVTRTVSTRQVGAPDVVEQQTVTANGIPAEDFPLAKLEQILWFVAHFIAIVLGLRFLFLLLGARLVGIVLFIYNLSGIFVAPFRGIFPSPAAGGSYFDTASVVAVLIYYLIVFLIVKGIWLMSRNTVETG